MSAISLSAVPTDVVSLLIQMVAVNTVNPRLNGSNLSEIALHEKIETFARKWDFKVERLRIGANNENYNLLVTLKISDAAPWILFESHSDTVGVEGMITDPFLAQIRGDKIYGRGTCDTKGSGAAALWALKEYSEFGDHTNNIAILFVTDEEVSKEGATSFVKEHLSKLPWRPHGIIVGEPTLCGLVVAHNGVIRWTVEVDGVPAHSSKPELGKSAITAMAKLVLGFERNYCETLNREHYLTGKAACSVNTISGGTSVNIIPAQCEVQIDRRILPGEVITEVVNEMSKVLHEVASSDSSISFRELDRFIDPALDPLINRAFAAKISLILEELSFASEELGVGYGSDASTYSSVGIPTIVLGPGSITQAHTSDEWIHISELEKSVAIYRKIMESNFL